MRAGPGMTKGCASGAPGLADVGGQSSVTMLYAALYAGCAGCAGGVAGNGLPPAVGRVWTVVWPTSGWELSVQARGRRYRRVVVKLQASSIWAWRMLVADGLRQPYAIGAAVNVKQWPGVPLGVGGCTASMYSTRTAPTGVCVAGGGGGSYRAAALGSYELLHVAARRRPVGVGSEGEMLQYNMHGYVYSWYRVRVRMPS